MDTKWLWIIGAFFLLLIVLVAFMASSSGPRAALPSLATQARPPTVSATTPSTGPGSSANLAPGMAGSNATLSGSQCRNTCRGQCGGGRPLVKLTRNQKSRAACHENCRASICNYVSSDDYGYDKD